MKILKNFLKRERIKKIKGFSLLELMVVLAIMGLLAGIAIPIILTVQRDSRDSQRLKQLEAISIAASKFYTEYAGQEFDIYTGTSTAPCGSPVQNNTTPPTTNTVTYYICPQNATGHDRVLQVTLTNGYYLRRASACGGTDVSKDKMIVFRIDRGGTNTQGFLVLCKESGGEQKLEYKLS